MLLQQHSFSRIPTGSICNGGVKTNVSLRKRTVQPHLIIKCFYAVQYIQYTVCSTGSADKLRGRVSFHALTVLGELEELSSSSGESSSSSGRVGMAGGSEGRERVWGNMKGPSAEQGPPHDSWELLSLCTRGDPSSEHPSSSWICKTIRHMMQKPYVYYAK